MFLMFRMSQNATDLKFKRKREDEKIPWVNTAYKRLMALVTVESYKKFKTVSVRLKTLSEREGMPRDGLKRSGSGR